MVGSRRTPELVIILQVSFGTAHVGANCSGSTVFATTLVTPAVSSAGAVDVVANAFGTSSPVSPLDRFNYDEFPELVTFQLPSAFFAIRKRYS